MKNILNEEHASLNGKWLQTYVNEDGIDDIKDGTHGSISEFENGIFRVLSAEGETILEGEYEINPFTNPKEIDWCDSIGDDAGKIFLSIYTLTDSSFRFCAANEGMSRPTAIESKKGHTIREFSRFTPELVSG